jgi:hypothetical protein
MDYQEVRGYYNTSYKWNKEMLIAVGYDGIKLVYPIARRIMKSAIREDDFRLTRRLKNVRFWTIFGHRSKFNLISSSAMLQISSSQLLLALHSPRHAVNFVIGHFKEILNFYS